LAGADRSTKEFRYLLGVVHHNLAELHLEIGQHELAEIEVKKAVEIEERLVVEYPDHTWYRDWLSRTCLVLGNLYQARKQTDLAKRAYQRGLALVDKLEQQEPLALHHTHRRAEILRNLGDLYAARSQQPAAETAYQKSVEILKKLTTIQPAASEFQLGVAESLKQLAALYEQMGKVDQAKDLYTQCRDRLEQLRRAGSLPPAQRTKLGEIDQRLGNLSAQQPRK
jgi:tetratricopeptide (TPR) repeat protein